MNGTLDVHPKVAGGTLAGAAALLIVWILSLCHVAVPDVAASALAVILGTLGGWLAPAGYPPAQPEPAPQPEPALQPEPAPAPPTA
jgi:hypothetical protein